MIELFFSKPERQLALRKGDLAALGIKTEGAVLGGSMSVGEAIERSSLFKAPQDCAELERARRLLDGVRRH